jgi:hypothetical protein
VGSSEQDKTLSKKRSSIIGTSNVVPRGRGIARRSRIGHESQMVSSTIYASYESGNVPESMFEGTI